MRRRASAASDRSTVRDSLMRASDSLILIRLSSCLGVAVMVCTHPLSETQTPCCSGLHLPVRKLFMDDHSEPGTH